MIFNVKATNYDAKIFTAYNYLIILQNYNLKTTKGEYKDEFYTVELNSLEELIQLQRDVCCELIIDRNNIEIYDDWKET
jgi:hypothetical protein